MEPNFVSHSHVQPKICVMPGCKECAGKNASLCKTHRAVGNDLRTPGYIAKYGFNNFYKMLLNMQKNIDVFSIVSKMENIIGSTSEQISKHFASQIDAIGKFLRTLRANNFIHKTGRSQGNVVYAINETLFPKVVVSIESEAPVNTNYPLIHQGNSIPVDEYQLGDREFRTPSHACPVIPQSIHEGDIELQPKNTKKIIRITAPQQQEKEKEEEINIVILGLKGKIEILEKQSEDSQNSIKRLNTVIEKLTQIIQKSVTDVQCPMLKMQMDMPKQLLDAFKGK